MRNIIQIKKATKVEVGEHILSPDTMGILTASEVISTQILDEGKWVEIGTLEAIGKRIFVVRAEDKVVVVI